MDSDIALWVIQYLHQHHPRQALSDLFERAMQETVAINTRRDTERTLRYTGWAWRPATA